MRKITLKQKNHSKRNGLLLGGLLILMMLLGILGYSFQIVDNDKNKKIRYNGFEFTEESGFWFTTIEGVQFSFRYNPLQITEIESDINIQLKNYYGEPLYFQSENSVALSEIYRNLEPFAQRVQEACLSEEKCEENLPIKSCKNNFVIIEEAESSEMHQEENCLFIKGKPDDLVMLADEALFKMLGIKQ